MCKNAKTLGHFKTHSEPQWFRNTALQSIVKNQVSNFSVM